MRTFKLKSNTQDKNKIIAAINRLVYKSGKKRMKKEVCIDIKSSCEYTNDSYFYTISFYWSKGAGYFYLREKTTPINYDELEEKVVRLERRTKEADYEYMWGCYDWREKPITSKKNIAKFAYDYINSYVYDLINFGCENVEINIQDKEPEIDFNCKASF